MVKKFHFFFMKNIDDIKGQFFKIPKLKETWIKEAILNYLLLIDDELKSAYKFKERYHDFNRLCDDKTYKGELEALIIDFRNHSHELFRDFGKLLENWKNAMINSFHRYDGRRVSNGPIESTMNRIKTIIKASNRIKDFDRLRKKILFSINREYHFSLYKKTKTAFFK